MEAQTFYYWRGNSEDGYVICRDDLVLRRFPPAGHPLWKSKRVTPDMIETYLDHVVDNLNKTIC